MAKDQEKTEKKDEGFGHIKQFLVRKYVLGIGALILIFGFAGISFYFYSQYQKLQANLKNTSSGSNQEIQDLVSKVGSLMELPSSDTPTIATVSDKTKLAGQSFFAHAENGDKVLIYTNSHEAILYRPSTNKIINVAPLNIAQNTAPTPQVQTLGASTSATLNVELYNGTTKTGLTKVMEKDLVGKFPNVTVVDRSNANKQDYKTTEVIDLSGTHAKDAASISQAYHGVIGSLPAGEDKPKGADILIIIGADYIK